MQGCALSFPAAREEHVGQYCKHNCCAQVILDCLRFNSSAAGCQLQACLGPLAPQTNVFVSDVQPRIARLTSSLEGRQADGGYLQQEATKVSFLSFTTSCISLKLCPCYSEIKRAREQALQSWLESSRALFLEQICQLPRRLQPPSDSKSA